MDQSYLNNLINYLKNDYYLAEDIKPISYGVQFYAYKNGQKHLIRVYQNTKGKIKLDLSQIKDSTLTKYLNAFSPNASITTNGQHQKEDIESNEILAPPLIGTDEAGKGDYFGYLCIAAVFADEEQYQELRKKNIKDSKLLKEAAINTSADMIKKICPNHSIIVISNEKFNQLYQKMNNMNAIMGWAHATAIKNVVTQTDCTRILTDKFGNEHWVEQHLKNTGVDLVQETKAERNLAVAAASILARNAVIENIRKMRKTYSIDFPLGASSQVDACGREFVMKYGANELNKVAKINFKNTQRIIT